MLTLFITSRLDTYTKDDMDNKIPKHFGNENHILDNLKKYIKNYKNLLLIASDPTNTGENDIRAKATFDSFALTLPFQNYHLLDNRNIDKAKELIDSADLIILSGGHVPTQNKFFQQINLANILKNKNDGVILGISAGSMNMAEIVYCPPEEEGEAFDPKFSRFFAGLGLTNINIMPHRTYCYNTPVDNKDIYKEFLVPDSHKIEIIAIEDGSYILVDNNQSTLYGEGYSLHKGIEKKICENNKSMVLRQII